MFPLLIEAKEPGMCNQEPQGGVCPLLTSSEELGAPMSSCCGAGPGSLCTEQPSHSRSSRPGAGTAVPSLAVDSLLQESSWEDSAVPLPCPDMGTPHTCPRLDCLPFSCHLTSVSMQPEAQDGSSVCKQRIFPDSWKSPKCSKIKPIFKFTWLVHNYCAKQGTRQDVALRAAAAQQQILQEKLNHGGPC